MAKYHINIKGEPGLCTAQNGNCPFGGEDVHFTSPEAARDAYEAYADNLRQEVDETFRTMFTMEKGLAKVSAQLSAVQKRILEGRSEDRADDIAKLERLEDTYHRGIAAVRRAFHAREMAWERAEAAGLVNPEDRKSNRTQESLAVNRQARKTLDLIAHFSPFKNDAFRASAIEELAAWGNMTYAEAEAKIDGYEAYAAEARERGEEPLSEDAYIVTLFQDSEDTERLVASVDLETTGFHPTNSEIIEIGIVVKNRKGEVVEVIDERFDLENPQVREILGVGPSHLHRIYPQDVAGKPTFADPAVQERIGRILNDRNVVVLAHNTSFERQQLNHYLRGFRQVRERYSAENLRNGTDPAPVTDTRALSGFFMHSTPNNKLDNFTRANGVAYVDGHSALPDAQMTVDALENFIRAVKEAPRGERPKLTLPAE